MKSEQEIRSRLAKLKEELAQEYPDWEMGVPANNKELVLKFTVVETIDWVLDDAE